MEEHKVEHHMGHRNEIHHSQQMKKKRKINGWKISTLVLLILLVVFTFTDFSLTSNNSSQDRVVSKALNSINQNLLQGQAVAELTGVEEEEGLYKLSLSIEGQEIDGYISKSGELFFPQVINLNEVYVGGSPPPPAEVQK